VGLVILLIDAIVTHARAQDLRNAGPVGAALTAALSADGS
jgi:hypothetical protein